MTLAKFKVKWVEVKLDGNAQIFLHDLIADPPIYKYIVIAYAIGN